LSYNYAVKTGSLKAFLERVKSKDLEVPDKVTIAYLESIGYKSTNDRPIIRVLKSIGFIDGNAIPTSKFKDFRTDSGQVMAEAVRKTYADLFKTYSNPLEKSREDLENFFAKAKPSVKKGVLGLYVDTFKTLCEFSDFKAMPSIEFKGEKAEETEEKAKKKEQIAPQIPEGFAINLNIQITLPVTDDAKVYENIFKALKEHVFKRD
jgi:hypothetical protein